jgi:hypothetical protein
VNYVLFFGALVLVMFLVWLPLSPDQPRAPARAYRNAFLASAGVPSLAWCLLYTADLVSLYGVLAAVAGSLVGGIITTTVDIGFIENAAPPSVGTRKNVPAYRGVGDLRCSRLEQAFCVVGALIGLVVMLPLWVVVAGLIWFEEPGPIFSIKKSVEEDGTTFRQLRFRAKKYEAERLAGLVASPAKAPRMLKAGWLLRRWHLDELPELTDVLANAIRLLGPRRLPAERHTVPADEPARVPRQAVRATRT